MDAAVCCWSPAASERLLAHCFALDSADDRRLPASERLEALLGLELSRRLVQALAPAR
jgi:hypothetical protein